MPDGAQRLADDCSISARQAYRYLQQAQRLEEHVAVAESKLAFTVKLAPNLISARAVVRICQTTLDQRGGRPRCSRCCHEGEVVAEAGSLSPRTFQVEYRLDRLAVRQTGPSLSGAGARSAPASLNRNTKLCTTDLEVSREQRARQRITKPVRQSMLICQQCGYPLYRTSTRASKQKINYYRCVGSDEYRHLKGAVCANQPIR